MLPSEQISQIKEQLIEQINSTFPEDKKEEAILRVESMDEEQLEEFLIQNNLIKDQNTKQSSANQCIFCSIASGDTKSYKLDENTDAVAVLEINPISEGHALIIPKKHIKSGDKIPQTAFTLAKKISKKIKDELKPKDIVITSTNLFGHEILNVLPIYKEENLGSERKKATPEELEELRYRLEKKQKQRIIKKSKPKKIEESKKEKLWLPKRIP